MLSYLGISTIALVAAVAVLGYIYMTRNFKYWKNRGVPYIHPTPFFGNYFEIATFRLSPSEAFKKIYDEIDAPYFGIFVLDDPVLMLKCPRLIHDILIKDSAQFMDRTTASADHDVVTSNILFFQKGLKFKQSRAKLTTIFSPAKLKGMSSVVNEISFNLLGHLSKVNVIEAKDVFNRFSTEIIARCLFGISTNCMDEKYSEFLSKSQKLLAFTWRNVFVHSSYFLKKELVKLFKLNFVESSVVDYLSSVILETLNCRKSNPGHSRDLVDVLKEMKYNDKTVDEEISTKDIQEIVGNALAFFFAGIDTLSSILSLTIYELAMHEDIQDQLRTEITKVAANYGGVTYESSQHVKLLDMCISETNRKYPLISHVCRTALNTYSFSGTDLTIEKGTSVYIPICGLHLDEKYFQNPEDYDPYRFENSYNPEGEVYYLPFGFGPRACIGERFSLLVMKMTIMHLLLKYKFTKCSTTPKKINFAIKSFFSRPETPMDVSVTQV